MNSFLSLVQIALFECIIYLCKVVFTPSINQESKEESADTNMYSNHCYG